MSGAESSHEYQGAFFDYINAGSLASARVVCPLLYGWLRPKSLLDVGSGAGAWCKIWKEQGIAEVLGVDGDYVATDSLLIPESDFLRRDLSKAFDVGQKFELVTSLEVAEHIQESSSRVFVENLVRHGDCVMFSAAVPGQGGEFHVNEQPLSYWRSLFAEHGYRCFDAVRSAISDQTAVEPWYRYNILLYARGEAIERLPAEVQAAELKDGAPIPDVSPLGWRARNAIIRSLPAPLVAQLVKIKHSISRRVRQP